MSERITKFIDVILPIAVPNLYTYRVPREWSKEVETGKRVVVQFGRKKLYTAIIDSVHERAPESYQAKYIESILDNSPIVTLSQIELWKWIASYYMCTIGEVMNAALPSGLKLASQTKILLGEHEKINIKTLTDKEYLIIEALKIQHILEIKEVEQILDIKTVYPILKSLIDKKLIVFAEEVNEKYRPKKVSYVQLSSSLREESKIKQVFDQLNRAPKQLDGFMLFLQEVGDNYELEVKKSSLTKRQEKIAPSINQLIKKGILTEEKKVENRIPKFSGETNNVFKLSEEQNKSLAQIKEGFKEDKTVLFHGVTGSGKTEIYVHLITKQLKQGKQVLYLLPEIALTTQIISRLQKFFGDQVGVFHSRFNSNERVETWMELLKENSRYKVIIGARSAIFLPFKNLGLIIVDEEHDYSFKQFDPAPRYHARDTAIFLAKKYKTNILLGSATPSIESYYNANSSKYHLVELKKRYGGIKLPEILCSDLQKAYKRKEMQSHFSKFLLEHMKNSLENGEQIILFQNRRGYNPLWSCESCGWVPQCKNCDVSMTYHKHIHALKCHYCGYAVKPENTCNACGSHKLKMVGFGTEKIEEELSLFFPDKTIKRMDLDTTRAKNSYQNLIDDFQDGLIHILVGTQMVTKGLDFNNVGLVGVLSGDSLLHYPDFRSFERSFHLLTQVAGRAGRKTKRGKVIIQTFSPDHWVVQKVIQNDYLGLYNQEILERRNFNYPPFYRLIKLTIKHKDRDLSLQTAKLLTKKLKKKLGERILGPEAPYISRIKNRYLNQIVIKFERELSPIKVKEYINSCIIEVSQLKTHKSSLIIADVDFV